MTDVADAALDRPYRDSQNAFSRKSLSSVDIGKGHRGKCCKHWKAGAPHETGVVLR